MTVASPTSLALIALMKLRGMGRRGALRIVDAPTALNVADYKEWVFTRASKARLPEDELTDAWSRAEELLTSSVEARVLALSFFDKGYPDRLRRIPDPPAVLYIKGDPANLEAARIAAIVGTREPTPYGAKVTRRLAEIVARHGFVIVSGLAHGCDTLGHEGCLDGGGLGVAVMAHGLDKVYPAANRDLAARLLAGGGCFVSEYPLGHAPMRTAFAERDRIQSGLSDAVLVIETDVKGGTMHTVRFARDQKRPLACLAHPSKWLSEAKTKGNQKLIADHWATPISDGDALTAFLADVAPNHRPRESSVPCEDAPETQHSWAF